MKIDLSGDYYEDCGIDSLVNELCGNNLSNFFKGKDYGNNEVEIFMVIICEPNKVKLRKRFDSKDQVLYWDVILNYEKVKSAKGNLKKALLANSIISSFDILDGYKKLNIQKTKLKEDANLFFKSIGWLQEMRVVV